MMMCSSFANFEDIIFKLLFLLLTLNMWSFAGIYWRTAGNKENVFFTDSFKKY